MTMPPCNRLLENEALAGMLPPRRAAGGARVRLSMAALSKQLQDLATADRHIAEGEARIAQQAEIVRALGADGHDTADARSLLRFMQRNLGVMNCHRQQILRECHALRMTDRS